MKEITTKDGSLTFFNDEFQEYYHSLSGAREEAVEKYVKPTLIFIKEKKLFEEEINILDFCYGLGYNSLMFLHEIRKSNDKVKINIVGIDNDMNIIEKGKEISRDLIDNLVYSDDKVNLRVEIDDAIEVINKLEEKFDVCFFDPFSLKRCPKLWDEEIFHRIYKLMNKKGILTTYSCARQVRENLKKAGFIVKDGPCVGRRAPSTIAFKDI